MPEEDLFVMVLNNPLFWILIMGIVMYFIVKELNKGKLKPEQKPDFGVKVRAKRVEEHLKKREKALAWKPEARAIIYMGIRPLGRIKKIEEIPQMIRSSNPSTKKKKDKAELEDQIFLWVLYYRRLGIWNWVMDFFGFGKQKILVDKDSILSNYDSDKKQIEYVIDRDAYFRERGGVLLLSRDPERVFIDEINADKDYENAKGFVSDFPRRLSNLHPSHAVTGDTMELESSLTEKAEEKKRFLWR